MISSAARPPPAPLGPEEGRAESDQLAFKARIFVLMKHRLREWRV